MGYETESDSNEHAFSLTGNNCQNEVIEVNVGGVFIKTLIDSGASTKVVDAETWNYLKRNKVKCTSERCMRKLCPYGSNKPLTTIG